MSTKTHSNVYEIRGCVGRLGAIRKNPRVPGGQQLLMRVKTNTMRNGQPHEVWHNVVVCGEKAKDVEEQFGPGDFVEVKGEFDCYPIGDRSQRNYFSRLLADEVVMLKLNPKRPLSAAMRQRIDEWDAEYAAAEERERATMVS